MKSYTDIDQSKKLAEILPIESVDMHYAKVINGFDLSKDWKNEAQLGSPSNKAHIPCWSLAALLDVLSVEVEIHRQTDEHKIYYYYVESYMKRMGKEIYLSTERHVSLVDACYEMILKLQYMKGE